MATNADLEANEETGLLLEEDGPKLSPADSQESEIWSEMDQPWPATFERSISLLASPVINAAEADHFTKSPLPGNTPLAARRRMVRIGGNKSARFSEKQGSLVLTRNSSSCVCAEVRNTTRNDPASFGPSQVY